MTAGQPDADAVASMDVGCDALDPTLRRALARLARAQEDRDPIEIQGLKSRRARRMSYFVGRCTPSRYGTVVHWGVVLKQCSPRRAGELVTLHQALRRALSRADELPAAPRIVSARAQDGWIALEAWPGLMMAGFPDPARRARHAARAGSLLASLEGSRRARRWWPGRGWTVDDEMRRLEEVWERAGEALPGWTPELARGLARSDAAPVPAHRDLNSEQVIVGPLAADTEASARWWIDWDQAALAPQGLDLGNLLAHERLGAVQAGGDGAEFDALRGGALTSYRNGGGRATVHELAAWEAVACLRLAALSLQRARGDDPITRNPAWLPAPSVRREEGVAMRRAARELFPAARAGSRRNR
ncbi:MAG: phosphotransferase family protein [Candidatus Eiseniibacteriota bacterium]